MAIQFETPKTISLKLAKNLQRKRLSRNLSQSSLADKAEVSYGTLKRFEQSGQISLLSLLKLAIVLDSLDEFKRIFSINSELKYTNLDAILKQKRRRRGHQ